MGAENWENIAEDIKVNARRIFTSYKFITI